MAGERGLGTPKTDAERAATHYGITVEEYEADPEAYPLTERGSGLSTGAGWGLLAIIGIAIFVLTRRK